MNSVYTKYTIDFKGEEQKDILIAMLSDWGIEGFEEEGSSLYASGKRDLIDESLIDEYLTNHDIFFEKTLIADQNWNEIWEASFAPVQVDDFAAVRAHFHPEMNNVQYEIVITPKMSFGTGHHATTFLMMQLMREVDFKAAHVFDFGTGTGILAILASMQGADKVLAVDNDPWCILNAEENIGQNNCNNITIKNAEVPPMEGNFDVVLANINRNIIRLHLGLLAALSDVNGTILLSGLLTIDEPEILEAASQLGLKLVKHLQKDGWIALKIEHKGLKKLADDNV
jgi:ribosomal protein L11 methyltransferase